MYPIDFVYMDNKKQELAPPDVILFPVMLIINLISFVGMEVLFKAAMGIKRFTVPEPISFALKLTLRGFWANIKFRDDKK